MRKLKLLFTAFAVMATSAVWAQSVGDVLTIDGKDYKVTGENLITNGSFDDGVVGWYSGNWNAASTSNYTLHSEGGFDGGAYLEYSAGGADADTNIRNRWSVETGKMYLFRCFTSGKTPTSGNLQYSKLCVANDNTTEGSTIYQLVWPADPEQTSDQWEENNFVFTASTAWILFRSSWTESTKLDGFFLGEVNALASKSDLATAIANATTFANGLADAVKEIFLGDIAIAQGVYDDAASTSDSYGEAISKLEEAEKTATAANTLYIDADQRAAEAGVELPAVATYADVYTLHKQIYQAVVAEFTQNGASFIPKFSDWEGDAVKHNPEQGWRDATEQYYYEQTGSDWSSSSWNRYKETTVTLPVGKYAFIIYGRGSTEATVSATVGETTVSVATKGDIGRGVNTSGEASYDPDDEYTRGGEGYGWDVRYVIFQSTGESLTLRIEGSASTNHQWMSFTEPVLLTTADNVAFAKENLLQQITTAQEIYEAKDGVGNGILQIPESAWNQLGEAILAAQSVYDNATATSADVNAAIEALILAVETYNATELTAPDAEKVYAVKNASIIEEDRYLSLVNGQVQITSVKQGLMFEKTEGGYYLTDGEQYVGLEGSNNWTMSAVADKKMVLSIAIADGKYTIHEAKGYIGTDTTEDGASCYANKAVSNNGYWTIEEVEAEATALSENVNYTEAGLYVDATLTRTINEGWNALVLPFAVEATTFGGDAVLALYTGDEINGDQLVLKFQTATEVAANTPFLLYAPAAMTTLNYTGILINAKHDVAGTNYDFVGFYGADDSPILNGDYIITGGIIKKAQGGNAIKPYRAYFKAKEELGGEEVRSVIFDIDGVATGISEISNAELLMDKQSGVYDLQGRHVSYTQKGVYILNGKKIVVK